MYPTFEIEGNPIAAPLCPRPPRNSRNGRSTKKSRCRHDIVHFRGTRVADLERRTAPAPASSCSFEPTRAKGEKKAKRAIIKLNDGNRGGTGRGVGGRDVTGNVTSRVISNYARVMRGSRVLGADFFFPRGRRYGISTERNFNFSRS